MLPKARQRLSGVFTSFPPKSNSICSNSRMTDRPASWRMPTPKQMEKLANSPLRTPRIDAPPPDAPLPQEYWDALLRDPRAAGRPWPPHPAAAAFPDLPRTAPGRVARCFRCVESQRLDAIRLLVRTRPAGRRVALTGGGFRRCACQSSLSAHSDPFSQKLMAIPEPFAVQMSGSLAAAKRRASTHLLHAAPSGSGSHRLKRRRPLLDLDAAGAPAALDPGEFVRNHTPVGQTRPFGCGLSSWSRPRIFRRKLSARPNTGNRRASVRI